MSLRTKLINEYCTWIKPFLIFFFFESFCFLVVIPSNRIVGFLCVLVVSFVFVHSLSRFQQFDLGSQSSTMSHSTQDDATAVVAEKEEEPTQPIRVLCFGGKKISRNILFIFFLHRFTYRRLKRSRSTISIQSKVYTLCHDARCAFEREKRK